MASKMTLSPAMFSIIFSLLSKTGFAAQTSGLFCERPVEKICESVEVRGNRLIYLDNLELKKGRPNEQQRKVINKNFLEIKNKFLRDLRRRNPDVVSSLEKIERSQFSSRYDILDFFSQSFYLTKFSVLLEPEILVRMGVFGLAHEFNAFNILASSDDKPIYGIALVHPELVTNKKLRPYLRFLIAHEFAHNFDPISYFASFSLKNGRHNFLPFDQEQYPFGDLLIKVRQIDGQGDRRLAETLPTFLLLKFYLKIFHEKNRLENSCKLWARSIVSKK